MKLWLNSEFNNGYNIALSKCKLVGDFSLLKGYLEDYFEVKSNFSYKSDNGFYYFGYSDRVSIEFDIQKKFRLRTLSVKYIDEDFYARVSSLTFERIVKGEYENTRVLKFDDYDCYISIINSKYNYELKIILIVFVNLCNYTFEIFPIYNDCNIIKDKNGLTISEYNKRYFIDINEMSCKLVV